MLGYEHERIQVWNDVRLGHIDMVKESADCSKRCWENGHYVDSVCSVNISCETALGVIGVLLYVVE